MPGAAARPCPIGGCPSLQPCGIHTPAQRHRAYDDQRGSSARRGYDARHRRWREEVLARDPVCVDCQRAPSAEADHRTPLGTPGYTDEQLWDLSNGDGLCRGCHERKKARERSWR